MLVVFGIWNYYKDMQNDALYKSVNEAIYKTPQLTTYRITGQTDNENVILEGEVPFEYHKSLAQKIVQKIDGVKSVDNRLIVVKSIDDPMQISSNIAYLIRGLNTQDGIDLTYTFKYPVLNISGTVWDSSRKDIVLKELEKLEGVNELINNIIISPPNKKLLIFFDIGSSSISKNQEKKLLEYAKFLNQLDKNLLVDIKGYSDSLGTLEDRKYIASNRAKVTAMILKEKFAIKQELVASGQDSIPDGLDIEKDADKARCCIVYIKNVEK